MWNSSAFLVFIYSAVLFLAIVLIKLFQKPFKFLLKLILNCAMGCAAILFVNTFCSSLGFQIALNAVTGVLCAFLGLASPIFLAAFNLFF